MKNDREIILENIRKSLSGSRKLKAEDKSLDLEIDKKLTKITPFNQSELNDQFIIELEKVNAEYITITDMDKVLPGLQELFKKNNVNRIAISDDSYIQEISETINGIEVTHAIKYEYPERKYRISEINVALVLAEYGIADNGTVVFLYDETKTTYPHFLCDWTVILVRNNSIVANQFELMKSIDNEKAKNMVFVTGPSRTADIEKELILGAHGPRRVTVIIIP